LGFCQFLEYQAPRKNPKPPLKNIDKLSNMLSIMQKPPHIVAVSQTKLTKKMDCHFQLL